MKKNWKWEFSFEWNTDYLYFKWWIFVVMCLSTIAEILLYLIFNQLPAIPIFFGICLGILWIWAVKILISKDPIKAISESFQALKGATRLLTGREDEKIWTIRQIVEENPDAQLRLNRGHHGHLESAEIILHIHPDHPDFPC